MVVWCLQDLITLCSASVCARCSFRAKARMRERWSLSPALLHTPALGSIGRFVIVGHHGVRNPGRKLSFLCIREKLYWREAFQRCELSVFCPSVSPGETSDCEPRCRPSAGKLLDIRQIKGAWHEILLLLLLLILFLTSGVMGLVCVALFGSILLISLSCFLPEWTSEW